MTVCRMTQFKIKIKVKVTGPLKFQKLHFSKSRHFDPHFEEVRGSIEPSLMAHWKARVEFLLSVIELLFLSLTVEALQGKTCPDSLLSGGGRSVRAKISGGRRRPSGTFF